MSFFQGYEKCQGEVRIENAIDGSFKIYTAPEKSIHNSHSVIEGERKYHDYVDCNSDIKKNLNLDVKTRLIRKELRDNEMIDSKVTNKVLQCKVNRERKKLNLSSKQIDLNELKETCESHSKKPKDSKDPYVMHYSIERIDTESLRYCIIIR